MSVLDKISAQGATWTKEERDLLGLTFGNVLDLFYPAQQAGKDGEPRQT
jgi:hypothetical protein